MSDFEKARQLMKEFQGDKYLFGSGVHRPGRQGRRRAG